MAYSWKQGESDANSDSERGANIRSAVGQSSSSGSSRFDARKRPRRALPGGIIKVESPSALDGALKALGRLAAPQLAAWRKRRWFTPKPTHAARKRRGNLLERAKEKEERTCVANTGQSTTRSLAPRAGSQASGRSRFLSNEKKK